MAIYTYKINDFEWHVSCDATLSEYIEHFFDHKLQENADEADLYFDAEMLIKEFFDTLPRTRVAGGE